MGGAQSTKKHDIIRVLTSETTLDEEDVVIARVDDLEIGKEERMKLGNEVTQRLLRNVMGSPSRSMAWETK